MARYRRAVIEGGSYFFTAVTERRLPTLTDEPIRRALREAIITVRERYPFDIDAWVLMPDHLHTIWTLPEGDGNFATRWRLIKTHVTKACGQQYTQTSLLTARRTAKKCGTLWQDRYWEHLLRNDADFKHHMDYVHFNPVKHGLVQRVCDWPFSSVHRWVKNGVYTTSWAGEISSQVGRDPLTRAVR